VKLSVVEKAQLAAMRQEQAFLLIATRPAWGGADIERHLSVFTRRNPFTHSMPQRLVWRQDTAGAL